MNEHLNCLPFIFIFVHHHHDRRSRRWLCDNAAKTIANKFACAQNEKEGRILNHLLFVINFMSKFAVMKKKYLNLLKLYSIA
jgi:hypothetical protein